MLIVTKDLLKNRLDKIVANNNHVYKGKSTSHKYKKRLYIYIYIGQKGQKSHIFAKSKEINEQKL